MDTDLCRYVMSKIMQSQGMDRLVCIDRISMLSFTAVSLPRVLTWQ